MFSFQGAQMIVFPEYGITGMGFSRLSFAPYLEDIPDPTVVTFNPCLEEGTNDTTPVLYRLSCLARNNSIYIVANMGDKKKCGPEATHCPINGQFQYNTNLVFDDKGLLIARYHKQHPFMGERKRIDIPKTPEHITFDTPFGKFGTFICFDVLFREPAVTLIEKFKVDHIVFPTAWFDQLPLFSAIGFHSSWARGMGVNYLGSNTHIPLLDSTGSGLYSPRGAEKYYRNVTLFSDGKLLISRLTSKPRRRNNVLKQVLEIIQMAKRPLQIEYTGPKNTFYSELFGDNFLFVTLEEPKGTVKLCYNNSRICCSLSYSMNKLDTEVYALGVFDGLHTKEGEYYLEICVLLKCAGKHQQSCGKKTNSAETIFNSFQLHGDFSTKFIYPQLISDGVNLLPDEWSYEPPNVIKASQPLSKGLITAALFGRNYNKDPAHSMMSHLSPSYMLYACVMFLFLAHFQ